MEEIKIFDGNMSLDESNDVIGPHNHKYAKNGVFKGNAPEMHFTSVRGNNKITNSNLITQYCAFNASAQWVYNCLPLTATATATYCSITGTANWYLCDFTAIAREAICTITGQAFQMYYYYNLVRCDGTPGTVVGRSKRQSIPLGQVYAAGDFGTYQCRYINSAASGPYYDYNLAGMPTQAPPYDFDLSNSSYVVLDPGGCANCLYCDPTVGAYATGYSATSAQLACYNRIAPPSAYPTYQDFLAGKKTIYMQCDQKQYGLRDGAIVYNSAPLNNPTGLVAAGWYSWSDPSDVTNTNAKVWYVSASDTIVSILHNEQTCASVGYPDLAGTYDYGCAGGGCNGTGYINVSSISGGNAYGYKWTITNPQGTTSGYLSIGQNVSGVTSSIASGTYTIRVYDSRQTVNTAYTVTLDCKCCTPLTGQVFQIYYYYILSRCDGSGTLVARSIRQSAPGGAFYLGGAFVKMNCASVSGTASGPSYDVNLDSLQPVSDCNNTSYCYTTPNSYGAGYDTTRPLACYHANYGYTNKITLYTYNTISVLANGVQVWTNYDGATGNLTGHPSTSNYYSYGGKIWTVDSNGILGNEANCSDYTIGAPTASISSGCTGYLGTGYIVINSWTGGVGEGYYARVYNGATFLTELYPGNQTISNLNNAQYTVVVGDYRRDTTTTYTNGSTNIGCSDYPAPVLAGDGTISVTSCDSLGYGTIRVNGISGGNGTGYYWTVDGYAGTNADGAYVGGFYGSGTVYTIRLYDSRGTVNTSYSLTVNCTPTTFYYLWTAIGCTTGATFSIKTTNNGSVGTTYKTRANTSANNCYTLYAYNGTTTNASGAITLGAVVSCDDAAQCYQL